MTLSEVRSIEQKIKNDLLLCKPKKYKRQNAVDFVEKYDSDPRLNVMTLVKAMKNTIKKYDNEEDRIKRLIECEKNYSKGYKIVAGIDEVGRGPLAGPVMTCAVVLPSDYSIHYVNDSKKLSAKQREELAEVLKEDAISYSIGLCDNNEIDDMNILNATYLAMKKAIEGLTIEPDLVLVDALTIPDIRMDQVGIVHGDAKTFSIGAASIIAKVERDHLMEELDSRYPEYGFRNNKGYGTHEHIEALKEFGPCPIHRKTFISNFFK